MSSADLITFVLSLAGTVCWGVCFWWMHRISQRQDALLTELKEQSGRIEQLAREEHELIKEVHPVVGQIKETVAEIADSTAVSKAEAFAGGAA